MKCGSTAATTTSAATPAARTPSRSRCPQCQPELREAEEDAEHDDRGEADADDPDVLDRERDAGDVDRPRRERARELAYGAAPDPARQAVDEDQQADRDDHDREDGA